MRTHVHVDGISQHTSAEIRETRMLIIGMKSFSVLQVIFLCVSGAFAFHYVALASTSTSLVFSKPYALHGSNLTTKTFTKNSIDNDGHENVVKSISSLLSESLNKSIGHFKYIQEVEDNSNKVNLSTIVFNTRNLTTALPTQPPCQTTTAKPSESTVEASSSSLSEKSDLQKVVIDANEIFDDNRTDSVATLPVLSYAFDFRERKPVEIEANSKVSFNLEDEDANRMTTPMPPTDVDLTEKDSKEFSEDDIKKQYYEVSGVSPPPETVDLHLVNQSNLVKEAANRVKIKGQISVDRSLNESVSVSESKSEEQSSTVIKQKFGTRFLKGDFRDGRVMSLIKTTPRSSSSSPSSSDEYLIQSSSNSNDSKDKNSTKFICVELIDGEVNHPIFHKEVFPELKTPSFIMPTIPRIPMKFETFLSYNLTSANKTEESASTESLRKTGGRTELEKSKFYAHHYRPIQLDSIEYMRKAPEEKARENTEEKMRDIITVPYGNYNSEAGYIPVTSKLSVESTDSSLSSGDKTGNHMKQRPGIVLPEITLNPSPLMTSVFEEDTHKESLKSASSYEEKQQSPLELNSDIGASNSGNLEDANIGISSDSTYPDAPIPVPAPITTSILENSLNDRKTLHELLSAHDLFNQHELTINPLTDMISHRPESNLFANYDRPKSSVHNIKDTIAHYSALGRPTHTNYKFGNPDHGILYYDPHLTYNQDPTLVSPYLATLQGAFIPQRPKKTVKKSKSRRKQNTTRKSRRNPVNFGDYKPSFYSQSAMPMLSPSNFMTFNMNKDDFNYEMPDIKKYYLISREDQAPSKPKRRRTSKSRHSNSRRSGHFKTRSSELGSKSVKFELKDALV